MSMTVSVPNHGPAGPPAAYASSCGSFDTKKAAACDSPFFDAKEMYRVMEETGRKLHIQLAFLYSNETKAAKKFIDAGDLGHLYHMRSYGFRRRGRSRAVPGPRVR